MTLLRFLSRHDCFVLFKPVFGGLCNLVYSNARELKTKLVSLSPYGPHSHGKQIWSFIVMNNPGSESFRGDWFVFLNNNFQFLNSISRSSIYFFTHTYFHKYFQIIIFSFYTHISNKPLKS